MTIIQTLIRLMRSPKYLKVTSTTACEQSQMLKLYVMYFFNEIKNEKKQIKNKNNEKKKNKKII